MKRAAAAFACALWITTGAARAHEPRLSVSLPSATVADAVRALGAAAHVNIVAEADTLRDQVSLTLVGVTLETALAALAQQDRLQVRRAGDVIYLGRAAASAGNRVMVFALHYANPESVARQLTSALPPGSLAYYDRAGHVFVSGGEESLAQAARLIAAFDSHATAGDRPPIAARTFKLRYAVPSELVKALRGQLPDTALIPFDQPQTIVVTGNADVLETARALIEQSDRPADQIAFEITVADVTPLDDTGNVGFRLGGISARAGFTPGSVSATTGSSIALAAQLNLLVQRGKGSILARPRLGTQNNREAFLHIGQRIPLIYFDARAGVFQKQDQDVGVRLRLTPQIGPSGDTTVKLHAEYSQVDAYENGYPVIGTRELDTFLRVADGETVVLAGLFSDVTRETVTEIPGLSKIPVLGAFFRNRESTHAKDELVFMITPHVERRAEAASGEGR